MSFGKDQEMKLREYKKIQLHLIVLSLGHLEMESVTCSNPCD